MIIERSALISVAWALLLALGCGSSPASQAQTPSLSPSESASEPAPTDEPSTEEDEPAPPAAPDCSDGTCFPCGAGICPRGAYCDEKAPAGPACAWLTECAGTPECSCIRRVLGSTCACEAASGGPVVGCP